VKQPSLVHVLTPKWRTALTRARQERDSGGRGKAIVLAVVGLIFWAAVFGVLFRVLRYFKNTEEIGALLAGKLLGILLLSFASVLLLSNVITALSSYFLAKDLDLLVSSPVDALRIYLAKLLETVIASSWMVALMAVPIFAAYGIVYRGGILFAPYAAAIFLPSLLLPAVIGVAVTTILVNVFPARRTRDPSRSSPSAPRPASSSSSASSAPSSWRAPRGSATCSTSSPCCGRRRRRSCRASGCRAA
jgi:ABC-2 type transport system permease protein